MKIKMPHFFRHYGSLKVLILVVILMMLLTHGIKGLKQNADIDKILTEAEMKDENRNLTNHQFKIGAVTCTIISHTQRKIKISILNKRAINK